MVHHLIFNYISPIFEKTFINDCYSCRKGKGTHYGIKRLDHFIRSCSENYKRDCYILKLDIKGYFMSMDRALLFEKIKEVLHRYERRIDFGLPLVLYLLEKIIFNDPTKNCIIKGRQSDWDGLPPAKSLFHAGENKGLPIGNLTSQLFGNIYLNEFDHFVKRDLGIKHYGRYVDDFVLIHRDRDYLKSLIPVIASYLKERFMLQLHPDKIYLQHFSKGVKFLGVVIKPQRIYIANRTKGNFFHAVQKQNEIARRGVPSADEQKAFVSIMNSYLGIMKPCKDKQPGKHYRTYTIRRKMIRSHLSPAWPIKEVIKFIKL